MKTLRKLSLLLVSITTLILLLFSSLYYLSPRIPLGILARPLSSFLSNVTGKSQYISGNIYLTPGAWTKLEITSAEIIFNSQADQRIKVTTTEATSRINLQSLLYGKLIIDVLSIKESVATIYPSKEKDDLLNEEKFRDNILSFLSFPVDILHFNILKLDLILKNTDTKDKQILIAEATGHHYNQSDSKIEVDAFLRNNRVQAEITLSQNDKTTDKQYRLTASSFSHGRSMLSIAGEISYDEEQVQLSGDFSFQGEELREVFAPLTHQFPKKSSFALDGTFFLDKSGIKTDITGSMPGARQFKLLVEANGYPWAVDQLTLSLKSDLLDFDKLIPLKPPTIGSGEKQQEADITKSMRDQIIFSHDIPIKNFSIEVDIAKLSAGGVYYEEVKLVSDMHNGRIKDSPFSFTMKQHQVSGEFSLILEQPTPELSVLLRLPILDLDTLLGEIEKGSNSTDFRTHDVTIELKTKGAVLGELLKNLIVQVDSSRGRLVYRDRNTGAPLEVTLEKLHMSAVPSDKVRLSLDGRIGNTPVKIAFHIDDKRNQLDPLSGDVSFKASVETAEAQLTVAGVVALPFRLEGLVLDSRLQGDRLSELDELLGVHLPDVGPYSVSARFSIVGSGYQLNSIEIMIGETHLSGDILVNTKSLPPSLHANLKSPYVQIDDFRTAWSANRSNIELTKRTQKNKKDNRTSEEDDIPFITDQEVLDSYDAQIRISVNKVVSGQDFLGSGMLNIDQSNGTLHISPLTINLPRGAINLDYFIEPSNSYRRYKIDLKVEDFDYGILGRHLKPDSDIKGILDLHVLLDSTSPSRKEFLKNGNGYIDVMIQPEKLRAGVIDLWAVNLLHYLLPVMTPDKRSKINCFAGRFNIKEGVLTEEALLLDTSRIQVRGNAKVNFQEGWIESYLRPVPKRPQFYSLSTPVTVKGKLNDFKIRVARGGGWGTLIRLATSYIVVPLQWIILNRIPENGLTYCQEIIDAREFSATEKSITPAY